MSDVIQRFKLFTPRDGDFRMEPSPDGKYVLYDDHEQAIRRAKADGILIAKNQIGDLIAVIERAEGTFCDGLLGGDDDYARLSVGYVASMRDEISRVLKADPPNDLAGERDGIHPSR